VRACPKGKRASTLETWGVVYFFVGRRLYEKGYLVRVLFALQRGSTKEGLLKESREK